jgi:hypothetical protein
VDRALNDAFAAMADEQRQTAAQKLKSLMRGAVDSHRQGLRQDRWTRREVTGAIATVEMQNGVRLPSRAIETEWRRQREEIDRHGC